MQQIESSLWSEFWTDLKSSLFRFRIRLVILWRKSTLRSVSVVSNAVFKINFVSCLLNSVISFQFLADIYFYLKTTYWPACFAWSQWFCSPQLATFWLSESHWRFVSVQSKLFRAAKAIFTLPSAREGINLASLLDISSKFLTWITL